MAKGTDRQKGAAGSPIKTAWKLYNSGDVVGARRMAREVLASSPSAADTEQAKDLIERTNTPRFAWYLALVAAALILTMIGLALARR